MLINKSLSIDVAYALGHPVDEKLLAYMTQTVYVCVLVYSVRVCIGSETIKTKK